MNKVHDNLILNIPKDLADGFHLSISQRLLNPFSSIFTSIIWTFALLFYKSYGICDCCLCKSLGSIWERVRSIWLFKTEVRSQGCLQVKNCVWGNLRRWASFDCLSVAGIKPQGRFQISEDSWDELVSVTGINIGRAPLQGSQRWCCFSSPPADTSLFITTQES